MSRALPCQQHMWDWKEIWGSKEVLRTVREIHDLILHLAWLHPKAVMHCVILLAEAGLPWGNMDDSSTSSRGWVWMVMAVTLPAPLALKALGNAPTENQAGLCPPPVSVEGCLLRRSSTACHPLRSSGSPDRELVQLARPRLCISPKEHHKLFPTYQREFIFFFFADFQLLPL